MTKRGRPRSPEADEAILDATVAELTRVGYTGLAVERVAAVAGVGKATIYRRHPSKIALVTAAGARARAAAFPNLDTGSLRGDALTLLGVSLEILSSVWGRVLPGMLAEASEDPKVAAVLQGFFSFRRTAVADMLRRGIERGEVRPDADPSIAYAMIDGALLTRMLVTGEPLDQAFIEALVEGVIRGVGVG